MDTVVFGTRIRQAREAKGLSQEELAARVGKSQKAISQYENGSRRMFVNDLTRFSEALQAPVSFFLSGEMMSDEVDALILAEVQRLSTPDEKQALLKIVHAFCDFAKPDV